jgi:DNA-binding transcriptional MocR family regulator
VRCEERAESRGVEYGSGKSFHVDNEDVPYLRLAFGYPSLDEIREGIPVLADCVRESCGK